jgi:hypothetical protein
MSLRSNLLGQQGDAILEGKSEPGEGICDPKATPLDKILFNSKLRRLQGPARGASLHCKAEIFLRAKLAPITTFTRVCVICIENGGGPRSPHTRRMVCKLIYAAGRVVRPAGRDDVSLPIRSPLTMDSISVTILRGRLCPPSSRSFYGTMPARSWVME